MRFFSFGTDFKYAMGAILNQELYTDGPDGQPVFALIVEAAPAAQAAGHLPGYQLNAEGRPLVALPDSSLDYEGIIRACHIWMSHAGLVDEPVWFLALPPGKSPAEFLTF